MIDTSDWNADDWAHAYAAVISARRIAKAHKEYEKRVGRQACCDREALGKGCVCWQDRW